jgi:hypothetical protein
MFDYLYSIDKRDTVLASCAANLIHEALLRTIQWLRHTSVNCASWTPVRRNLALSRANCSSFAAMAPH